MAGIKDRLPAKGSPLGGLSLLPEASSPMREARYGEASPGMPASMREQVCSKQPKRLVVSLGQ